MKRSQSLCIAVSGPSSCWREILRTHCWLAPAEPVYIRRRLFWRPCFHAAAAAHEGHHPPCTSGRGLVTLAITCGWAEKPLLVPRSPQGQRLYSGLAALRQIAAFIRSIVGGWDDRTPLWGQDPWWDDGSRMWLNMCLAMWKSNSDRRRGTWPLCDSIAQLTRSYCCLMFLSVGFKGPISQQFSDICV